MNCERCGSSGHLSCEEIPGSPAIDEWWARHFGESPVILDACLAHEGDMPPELRVWWDAYKAEREAKGNPVR